MTIGADVAPAQTAGHRGFFEASRARFSVFV